MANDKIGSFTAPTAQARLALWLLAHGPQPQVESYTQLSRELNLGRASLYRALESLEGEGIIQRQVQGVIKDYIKIAYQGTDTLFVPATQLDLVSKYIGGGPDNGNVRLNKIGTDACV